jgi:iron complex transport system ATP-binding protein
MSTGEARRVLLAACARHRARALILDEPTTGLDLVARHDFTERVRQVARAGTTISS